MTDAIVICAGNRFRQDDGAGLAVAAELRGVVPVVEVTGEATELLQAWEEAELAVVVDAVRSGNPPGTVRRLTTDSPDARFVGMTATSTHGSGLEAAIGLGRAFGCLPARLVIYGIEAARTGEGEGLSPRVKAAVPDVARRVLEEVTGPCVKAS